MGRKGKDLQGNNTDSNQTEQGTSNTQLGSVGSEKVQEYQQKTSKLFIGGLPQDATDDELEEVFSNIGPLKKGASFVVKGRGIAFVHYVLGEDADDAIKKLHGSKFRGHVISVGYSKKRLAKGEAPAKTPAQSAAKPASDAKLEAKPAAKPAAKPVVAAAKPDAEPAVKPVAKAAAEPAAKPVVAATKPDTEPAAKPVAKPVIPKAPKRPTANDQIAVDSSGIAARVVVLSGLEGVFLTIGWVNSNCSRYGNVEKIEFPHNQPKTAFVQFKKIPEAVEAVKQLNEEFSGAGVTAALYSATSVKRFRLIVRNLPWAYTLAEFKEQFSQYGKIFEISLPPSKKFPDNHCGFGFVNYTNFPDTEKAMCEGNKLNIKGRQIAIDYAMPLDLYKQAQLEQQKAEKEAKEKAKKQAEESEEDEEMDEEDEEMDDEEMDDDEDMEDEDDEDEDMEDEDEDDEEDEDERESRDVKEGRTLFIRNLPFTTNEQEVKNLFSQYGPIKSVKLTINPDTGNIKGTGFVEFQKPEHAALCLEMAYQSKAFQDTQKQKKLPRKLRKDKIRERRAEESDLSVGGRNLIIAKALSRAEAERVAESDKDKKAEDKRNLHLAEIGVIKPDSLEAQTLSHKEMQKRLRSWQEKKVKLANPNFHVSPTRLAIGNIPKAVTEAELKELFKKSSNNGKIMQVKIVRDPEVKDKEGNPMSKGFGFVEFSAHHEALLALNATNNKPNLFPKFKTSRLIVEFAVENILKLQAREAKNKAIRAKNRKRKREDEDEDDDSTPKKMPRGKRQRLKRRQQREQEQSKQSKVESDSTNNNDNNITNSENNKAKDNNTKTKTTSAPSTPDGKTERQLAPRARQRVRKTEKEREKARAIREKHANDPFYFDARDFTPEPVNKKSRRTSKTTKKGDGSDFEKLVASYTQVLTRPQKKWDEL